MRNLLVFIVFYLPPILFSAILPFICNYSVHFVVQSHMQSHTQRLHLTYISWFVCSSPYSMKNLFYLLIINHFMYFSNTQPFKYSNSQFDNHIDGYYIWNWLLPLVWFLKGGNPNLLYAWFLWVEEWPGLHMLGNQFTAHLGYFLPPPQNGQGQLLFVVLTTFYELRKSFLQVLCISNDLKSSTCYMTIKLKFQSGYTWFWYNSK